jgi:Zn-dependent M28 family amino/carboxypeptidase
MLYPEGEYDLLKGGKTAGQALRDDYREHRYHAPSDEWRADWDLSGVVEDLKVLRQVGDVVANSSDWPNWYPSNEFRAIRDKGMTKK